MGGCTLTMISDTREEAIAYIKTQILGAAEAGLWPDSELVVLQEGAEKAELYQVSLNYGRSELEEDDYTVTLMRVEIGRFFHVGTAARYNRTLKPGEWVATVHVHS